jgi:hypothetical protein
LVVQNEVLEFVVTLHNPYIFDLELQTLAIRYDHWLQYYAVDNLVDYSTTGVAFDSKSVAVSIPANSLHPVVITGKALQPGVLVIRGCLVRAPGGASMEFALPLSTDEEDSRVSRKRSAMQCERGRSKYSGLDSFPWEKAKKRGSIRISIPRRESLRFLECRVVEEQPLLRVRRSSVTHGALMLYNGEK